MSVVPREMRGDDFQWAAGLMERRRSAYAAFAPVFWRPAVGATSGHAAFLRSQADAGSAVAVRSDRGFVLATAGADRYDVDDFAVEPDERWASEGPALLGAVVALGPLPAPARLRVVTARQDAPKVAMLVALGMSPVARWWVRSLRPREPAPVAFAQVVVAEVSALFVPAPPVYDPGGPVCILGDVDAGSAVRAAEEAEARGAVAAVVTRDRAPAAAPEREPALTSAGFDNVSVFFEGALPRAG